MLTEIEEGLQLDLGENRVVRHRFYPDTVCISTAIDVLCKNGQPEKAMEYMVMQWSSIILRSGFLSSTTVSS
jgi:pentatricopeptide repeat protein